MLVHGSEKEWQEGERLEPHPEYLERWGESFVYQVLEPHRPKHMLPHENSVFMVSDENEDDIVHAGGPRSGWKLYLLPEGKVEKHNLAWLDDIVDLVSEGVDMDSPEIAKAAERYWYGDCHDSKPDTWEYVAVAAVVDRCQAYDVDAPFVKM